MIERKQIPRTYAGKKTTDREEYDIGRIQEDMKSKSKGVVSWLEAKHAYFEAKQKGTLKVLLSSIDGPMREMRDKMQASYEKAKEQPKNSTVVEKKPGKKAKLTISETKLGVTMVLSKEDCKQLGFTGSEITREVINTVRKKLGLQTKAELKTAKENTQ